jgi:uncharacterized membrane protein
MKAVAEERIHRLFRLSVAAKGIHALIECLGGLALAFMTTGAIQGLVAALTQDELVEDPNDFVATRLLHLAQTFSVSSKNFYAFYLLSHGVVKLFLVAALLRDRVWAYPASLVVLGLFILYQVYRFTFTPSAGLVLLTIFDGIVMVLIWHEYRLIRRHLPRQ